ncbi:Ig-like domain-containing protein [Terrimonas alba]|uniref:Ig-like domain-containing protein n=1 Tax=Terrimonas alba TaxID=3349636 RepID=UPI0035F2F37F
MFQIYNAKTNRQKKSWAVKNIIGLIFCIISQTVFSQTIVVTTTNDVVDGNTTNIATLTGAPGADGLISLREAVMATNGEPSGSNITISLPAAILILSIAGTGETAGAPNAAIGDLDLLAPATGTKTVSINGAGPASTIISQTTGADRIIDAHPNSTVAGGGNITLNISGVKITGGVASAPVSGGAILAGRPSDVTTLTNCLFDLNSATANGGAISQSSGLASHNLTITNCTFTNNTAGGAGGAVSYNGLGIVLITGSIFTSNKTTITGGDGGALSTTGGGNGGTYTVEKNTFLNNQALNPTSHAGAVLNTNGALTLRYNRFIGNTCANTSNPPLANVIAQTGGSTVNTTIADNNWWGVNTGPGTNDATALAAGGTMTLTKWLQLKTTASPNPICNTTAGLGNTTTVTTSFLSNSAGEAILLANLPVLIGLPVTWSQTLGSLSSQQSTIQASGTATALFTSNGTGGTATVNTQVDNVPASETSPARANITVNTLPIVTNPVNTTACVGGTATFTSTITGTPPPTIHWRIGTTALVDGLQASGSTVSGANTATLTITNVQLGDALTNYNVEASNHCGTANSSSATLTVNIPSIAPSSISGTTIYCNPGSTTLTAVGGTLGTGANYQWGTGSVVGTSPLAGETSSTLTVSPTITTTYWVRIENTAAPCDPNTSGVTQVVTVNQPSVAPTSITGTSTICNGSSTTLTAVGGTLGTGANYQWGTGSIVGTSPLVGETSSTLTVSPTSTTTYWVRIENTAAPCTANTGGVTQEVAVNQPSVAPTSIAGTTTICNGSSTILTAIGGTLGAGANYQWGTGSIVGTSPLTGETSSTLTVSPTSTTTYWVRIENTTAPCPASTDGPTQVVTVNQLSVAPTGATGTTTICNGGSTILTVAGGTKGTGATTEWFTGSCDGTPAGTGDAITVSPTSTTTYYVRYSGTCNTTTCAEVTVSIASNNSISLTSAAGTDAQAVCDNATITDITYATTGATGASVTGLPAGVNGSWLANVVTISGSPTVGGTFNYTVTLTGGCGNVSTTGSITVSTFPVVTAPTVTQPTCAVPTGTIVVNATGSSGTLEYRLNAGEWGTSNTFDLLAPGDYNIYVRYQNSSCVSIYSSNPVSIIAATGCTEPPVITCPSNITTAAASGECDASVSFAATATGIPSPTIVYKIGSTTITSPYTFPVGTTTVNCTATNSEGTDNCSFTVTVTDDQAPVINTNPNPIVLLWSPNHKYQKITVSQCVSSVTDNCGNILVANVVITHVTSDEAENAPGNADGNTTDDMKIASNCKSVELRRERMDGGNGRVYTIHLKVTDVNGNTATATVKAVAPISQSGVTAVDNGPVYTESGPCQIATRSSSSQLITKNTEVKEYIMAQNYPNPFSTISTIRYELPVDAHVSLSVYNQLGQKVAQLTEGNMSAGYHQARVDATKLAAGIYLYRLLAIDANGKPFVISKKMIVAK